MAGSRTATLKTASYGGLIQPSRTRTYDSLSQLTPSIQLLKKSVDTQNKLIMGSMPNKRATAISSSVAKLPQSIQDTAEVKKLTKRVSQLTSANDGQYDVKTRAIIAHKLDQVHTAIDNLSEHLIKDGAGDIGKISKLLGEESPTVSKLDAIKVNLNKVQLSTEKSTKVILAKTNAESDQVARSVSSTFENPNLLLNQEIDGVKDQQVITNELLKHMLNSFQKMTELTKKIEKNGGSGGGGGGGGILGTVAAGAAGLLGGKALSKIAGTKLGGKVLGKMAGSKLGASVLKRIPGGEAFLGKLGSEGAEATSKVAAKEGTEAAGKLAAKGGAEVAGKVVAKEGAELAGKTAGKTLLKKIPGVGLLAGGAFAVDRAMEGDYTGAALEATSGLLSTIPVVGTAASLGVDGYLAARDLGVVGDKAGALKQAQDDGKSHKSLKTHVFGDPSKPLFGSSLGTTAMGNGQVNYNTTKGSKDNLELAKGFTSKGTIKGMNEAQTRAYAADVMQTESGGKLGIVNDWGYLGQYQFGAAALADQGLINKDKWKAYEKAQGKNMFTGGKGKTAHEAFLNDPSNWSIEGGKDEFLRNKALQDDTFVKFTNNNIDYGLKSKSKFGGKSAITGDSSAAEIAAYAKASHLKGAGAADNLMLGGVDSKDALGTRASDYAKGAAASMNALSPQVASSMKLPNDKGLLASAGDQIKDKANKAIDAVDTGVRDTLGIKRSVPTYSQGRLDALTEEQKGMSKAAQAEYDPGVKYQKSGFQTGRGTAGYVAPAVAPSQTLASAPASAPTMTANAGTAPIANLAQAEVGTRAPTPAPTRDRQVAANPLSSNRSAPGHGLKGSESPTHLDDMGIVLINTGML